MDFFDNEKDLKHAHKGAGDSKPYDPNEQELLNFLQGGDSTPQHHQHQKKSSDDFEHVDPFSDYKDKIDSQIHKTSDDFNDFMGNTNKQFQNFSNNMEHVGNDLLSNLDKKIENTKDFMAAERGNVFVEQNQPRQPNLAPAPAPSQFKIEQTNSDDDDDDNFNIDSYNPSPIKKPFKIADEHNEKFISSEDLLGDFKDERTTTPKKNILPASNIGLNTNKEFIGIAPIPVEPTAPPKLIERKIIDERPSVPPPAIPTRIEDIKEPTPSPILPPKIEKKKLQERPQMIQAEEMFYKFGLDAWFKPDRLHPKVESLIYWRDVKKSGIVFAAGLVTLLAISFFSAISVVAYLSLMVLTGTIFYRIYMNVVGAIQKTSNGHPFKEYLEWDLNLSQEKVQQISSVGVAHVNAFVGELRRLFLVEDLVDSLKFGGILWIFTYIGAWFNGMTLVILSFLALFSLPKVYEQNKQIIDQNLDIVRSKFLEITDKIKVAIPIGKKPTETDKDK